MTTSQSFEFPPKEGFIVTHFLTVADVGRSADFYERILGGTVLRSGEPTFLRLANSWLILNVGGGPTDDKPTVTLAPPHFLTEPKDHTYEIRCYMRDPDGYIIEVGQSKAP
jgi:catechol 2,3-dioxygenase-like lactoylglutathione lyase family enzyme